VEGEILVFTGTYYYKK